MRSKNKYQQRLKQKRFLLIQKEFKLQHLKAKIESGKHDNAWLAPFGFSIISEINTISRTPVMLFRPDAPTLDPRRVKRFLGESISVNVNVGNNLKNLITKQFGSETIIEV